MTEQETPTTTGIAQRIGTALRPVGQFAARVSRWLDQVFTWVGKWVLRIRDWWDSVDIPLTTFQWVLLLYGILALIFVFATPVFEAGDEIQHFGVIEHIRETGDYPVMNPDAPTVYGAAPSNPPLYYYATQILTAPVDFGDIDAYRETNPYTEAGNKFSRSNKNLNLPTTTPPTGTALAVVVLRLVNVALGGVTLWAVNQVGQRLAPKRPVVGLMTMLLIALNPMFLFVSASVNPIPLAVALNTLAALLLVRIYHAGFNWRWGAGLAALLGVSLLVHLSAWVLLPIVLLLLLYVGRRDRKPRPTRLAVGLVLAIFVLIGGVWIAHNLGLYGEAFGSHTASTITERFGYRHDFGFDGLRTSFWGLFGVLNVETSSLWYLMLDFVGLMALGGLVFLWLQLYSIRDFGYAKREWILLSFFLLVLVLSVLAVMLWFGIPAGWHGALLFPFLGFLMPLMAIGLVEVFWWSIFLFTPPDRSFVREGDAVPNPVLEQSIRYPAYAFGLLALFIPLSVIAPQYTPPAAEDRLPDSAVAVFADYGDVSLRGYEVLTVNNRFRRGSVLPVRLYWRAEEQTTEDLIVSLGVLTHNTDSIILAEGEVVPSVLELGKADSLPGSGLLRTSTWEVGKLYADTHYIQLNDKLAGAFPLELEVGWRDFDTQASLPAQDAEEQPLPHILLDVGAFVTSTHIDEPEFPDIEGDRPVFGNRIELERFFMDVLANRVHLQWRATAHVENNYQTFIHILDADGNKVAQSDLEPQTLATRYWLRDDRWAVTYNVEPFNQLPPGEYQVITGWYPLDDPTMRLEIAFEQGGLLGSSLVTPSFEDEDEFEATAEATAETTPDPSVPDPEILMQQAFPVFRFIVDESGEVTIPQQAAYLEALIEETPEATGEATSEATAEAVPSAPTAEGE